MLGGGGGGRGVTLLSFLHSYISLQSLNPLHNNTPTTSQGLVVGPVDFQTYLPNTPPYSTVLGPLMRGGGGSPCHMSILINYHIPCRYFNSFQVNFQNVTCQNDESFASVIFFLTLISFMSHFDYKKSELFHKITMST